MLDDHDSLLRFGILQNHFRDPIRQLIRVQDQGLDKGRGFSSVDATLFGPGLIQTLYRFDLAVQFGFEDGQLPCKFKGLHIKELELLHVLRKNRRRRGIVQCEDKAFGRRILALDALVDDGRYLRRTRDLCASDRSGGEIRCAVQQSFRLIVVVLHPVLLQPGLQSVDHSETCRLLLLIFPHVVFITGQARRRLDVEPLHKKLE
jgi:hypothetical protein